jgi:hypothetical protein
MKLRARLMLLFGMLVAIGCSLVVALSKRSCVPVHPRLERVVESRDPCQAGVSIGPSAIVTSRAPDGSRIDITESRASKLLIDVLAQGSRRIIPHAKGHIRRELTIQNGSEYINVAVFDYPLCVEAGGAYFGISEEELRTLSGDSL